MITNDELILLTSTVLSVAWHWALKIKDYTVISSFSMLILTRVSFSTNSRKDVCSASVAEIHRLTEFITSFHYK